MGLDTLELMKQLTPSNPNVEDGKRKWLVPLNFNSHTSWRRIFTKIVAIPLCQMF